MAAARRSSLALALLAGASGAPMAHDARAAALAPAADSNATDTTLVDPSAVGIMSATGEVMLMTGSAMGSATGSVFGGHAPPPPIAAETACLSHDVYLAVADAVAVATTSNLTSALTNTSAIMSGTLSHDIVTQIIVLSIIGVLSFMLLIFGSTFTSASLSITLFLVVFCFVFGIADTMSYDENLPATFSMCVTPFAMAIMAGILMSILSLCLIVRVASLSFFLLGMCVGGVSMYAIRDVIISASPALAADPSFGIYWLVTAIVMFAGGFAALCAKELIFVVATCVVGAYGFAVFVCGLVPVVGGQPIGGGSFISIMIAAGAVGGAVQYCMFKKEKPKTVENTSNKALLGK